MSASDFVNLSTSTLAQNVTIALTPTERKMLLRATRVAASEDLNAGLRQLGITRDEWTAFRSAVLKLGGEDPGASTDGYAKKVER